MYNDFFGFRERPFSVTPDPRVFYTTPTYQRVYDTLVYGIKEGKSLCVLSGEVGTGKTTILRRIMKDLEASVRFAYFTYTTLTFNDLLDFLCDDLGLSAPEGGHFQKLKALEGFLNNCHNEGHNAALLIDEAQNLEETVLEAIRHLLNLTNENKALLPIVLVGQPELERKLAQPSLYQLKQRIDLNCQLDRLKDRDIAPFIFHRLRAIGYESDNLFPPEALERITFYVKGIPRLINIVCDNALLLAYSLSQKTVSVEIIDEVAQDLGLQQTPTFEQENIFPAETGNPIVQGQERPKGFTANLQETSSGNPLPPLESERAHSHSRVGTPRGPSQNVQNKRRTENNRIIEWIPPQTDPRWRFSRRLVWVGAGLAAFALWSFTLLPREDSDSSFFSSASSALQESAPSHLSDRTVLSIAQNEINALMQQRDNPLLNQQGKGTTSSLKSAKEEQKQGKDEKKKTLLTSPSSNASLATKEEKAPSQVSVQGRDPRQLSSQQSERASRTENRGRRKEGLTQAHPLSLNAPLLIEAAAKGDTTRVEMLLQEGISPDMVDERQWTALMMAALHGHTSMVQLLLKKGADVNIRNTTGSTALMMAAIQGHRDALQILLNNRAKVDLQDEKGWTALMYAARNGHTAIVQSLLAAGANAQLKNGEGWTAAMYATNQGHQETVHALLNAGAKTTLHN